MEKKKSDDLINRLIKNQITGEELQALLDGMDDEASVRDYEGSLKIHFDYIMDKYNNKKKGGKQ